MTALPSTFHLMVQTEDGLNCFPILADRAVTGAHTVLFLREDKPVAEANLDQIVFWALVDPEETAN